MDPTRTAARRSGAFGALLIAMLVIGFSGGWRTGRITLDGNGVVLFVDIALRYWRTTGHVPYWIPDLWAGAPVWALAPIFPVLALVPLASWLGPEHAVRVATLGLQIAGGWGAMVLATSLWRDEDRRAPVAVVATAAGCLYALHPIVISHGAFFGHETSNAVFAATPWLIWALRRALRGDGARWVVITGLLAAFAILHQAEHAYVLVMVCAFVVVAQWAAAVRGAGGWSAWAEGVKGRPAMATRRVLAAATAVVVVVGGVLAHWILPLVSLSRDFILSPPDLVSASLVNGIGGEIGRSPGAFVTRSPGLAPVVSYAHPDLLLSGSFYLGWVWLAGSLGALVILALRPRRDADATLSSLALASAIGVWMSTAAIPLARSDPGRHHQWIGLVAIGVVTGLCIGVYLQRVFRGAVAIGIGIVAASATFAVPYVTPFLIFQHLAPLASSLRFPRLYPLAALGLSLGAAYPLVVLAGVMARHEVDGAAAGVDPALPSPKLVGAMAASFGLVAMAVLDAWSYRSFYRTRPPADAAPYAAALAGLPRSGGRLLTEQFGDPRIVEDLFSRGFAQASGWPHPLAQKDLWDLVVVPQAAAPSGYRTTAAALAGSQGQTTERSPLPPPPRNRAEYDALNHAVSQPAVSAPAVRTVDVEAIPGLPLVRAYDRALVVDTTASSAATDLAVAMVPDHVSVVSGGPAVARALGPIALGGAAQPVGCSSFGAEPSSPVLAGELAMACAIHLFVHGFPTGETHMGPGVGGVFSAGPGLEGISVWLHGPATGVHLSLRPASAGGVLGPPVAGADAGAVDRAGMTEFRFDAPVAPGRYGFVVTCPDCGGGGPTFGYTATAITGTSSSRPGADSGPGDMIVDKELGSDLLAGFAPIYARMAPEPSSTAALRVVGRAPGSWDVEVRAERPQLVVVAESHFAGWRGSVDGRAAAVLTADRAFVGVAVPAGDHHLRLRYRPPVTVPAGYAITGLTLAVCAAVILVPRRRWVERAATIAAGARAAGRLRVDRSP